MDIGFLLLWLGVSLWLGLMLMVLFVSLWPDVLRLLKGLVCPPDTKMLIEKYKYSYHRPGEYALGVYYVDQDQRRHEIRGRTLFAAWGVCSLFALPFGLMLVMWFQQLPK